ncbi:hypothetical protein [Streptomyces sp. NPDC016172]|uniref:hypothetical protein n=1 Tax=Streptomyces sp. NPDC016172 TaxID=3364964 RepID=UPI0036FB8A26
MDRSPSDGLLPMPLVRPAPPVERPGGRPYRKRRVPADVRDEAHADLAALTAGRPAPLTRFVQ